MADEPPLEPPLEPPREPPREPLVLDDDDLEGSEFSHGSVVLLVDLRSAPQFNGKAALVLRYLPERRRFEVALHQGGDVKAVQVSNLVAMPLADEVVLWREELRRPDIKPHEALIALMRLEKLPMTVDVLSKTLVGKFANELSKRLAEHAEVVSMSKQLVQRWRTMYQRDKAERERLGATGASFTNENSAHSAMPAAAAGGSILEAASKSVPAAASAVPTATAPKVSAAAVAASTSATAPNVPKLQTVAETVSSGTPKASAKPEPAPSAAAVPSVSRDALPSDESNFIEALPEGGAKRSRALALAGASADSADSSSEPDSKRSRLEGLPLPPLPPELAGLHPGIAEFLITKPWVLEFLIKKRSVLQNFSAEGVKFLVRNLKNSRDTLEEAAGDMQGQSAGRTVTFSSLSPEVSEEEIMSLIDDAGLGPADVTLPRNSRNRRSCGVAFAVMPSTEAAHAAVRELHGAKLPGHPHPVRVDIVDGSLSNFSNAWSTSNVRIDQNGTIDVETMGEDPMSARRISWKKDEELWDVALFDRSEPVRTFGEKLSNLDGPATALVPMAAEAAARFHAAAKSERAEERKMMQDVMASASRCGQAEARLSVLL